MAEPGTVRLRLRDVAYTYAGRTATCALDGVTLDVGDQEVVALVGPVGCGKTTLVRLVAGFLTPTRGTVVCDDAIVTGPSPARGYLFQEEAIFPWMTVRDNVEFGLLARGWYGPARRKVSDELLDLIDLRAYADAYPRELSAGMSKMVEVARVLATGPALLLLDEPFGSLDAQTRARMQAELARLCGERRTTVVLVTHDVEEALALADRIVVLSPRPGRVQAAFAVELPRPRPLAVKLSPAFAALKQTVWAELGLEV